MSHVPHLEFGSLCPGPSQGTTPMGFCSHCLSLWLLLLGALWANIFPGTSGNVPGCNVCCCLLPSPRAPPRRARSQHLSSPLGQPPPARSPFTDPISVCTIPPLTDPPQLAPGPAAFVSHILGAPRGCRALMGLPWCWWGLSPFPGAAAYNFHHNTPQGGIFSKIFYFFSQY